MKWTSQAEEAISKVPFFVRRRVRKKVEEEAMRDGAAEVRLEHVRRCQRKFLDQMEEEVKGYQVEVCFGASGCPNRAVINDDITQRLEKCLSHWNLKAFLKGRVKGPLRMHHEFRVSVSDCPNACSRPQIADIGLIGARRPKVSDRTCSRCGSCEQICQEGAIWAEEGGDAVVIDYERCVSCGQCLDVCPTGTLQEDIRGYRILLGGKLGRHPSLGKQLGGIYSIEEALKIVDRCLDYYWRHCQSGERFGEVLERIGFKDLFREIEVQP